ncbi:MAG: TetR/AcrR family transcriptional regulator [Lacisediminihabitans sp.]
MGRNRSFDAADVIAKCAEVFLRTGYEGTSIDDLVNATGLHRGSLYKAFGSKRGLFLAALHQLATLEASTPYGIDLLLVALLELAPRDAEVREVTAGILARFPNQNNAATLGARLLERAQVGITSIPDIS